MGGARHFIDWLVDIHAKFRLLPETLYLAVNIIDRFLSRRTISLSKLQLIGVTAMFIASKYEEVMCPSIQNFYYLADGRLHRPRDPARRALRAQGARL